MLTYTIDNDCALSRCIIFFRGFNPECANGGITCRTSHYITLVLFYKILSRCTVFCLETFVRVETQRAASLVNTLNTPRVFELFL